MLRFESLTLAGSICWILLCGLLALWLHFDRPKAIVVADPSLFPMACEANGYDSTECRKEMYVRINARLDRIEKAVFILSQEQKEKH